MRSLESAGETITVFAFALFPGRVEQEHNGRSRPSDNNNETIDQTMSELLQPLLK